MSKKNKKSIKVFYMSAEENTLRQMPKYNPFACGYGPHGNRGYNRRENKEALRREIYESF